MDAGSLVSVCIHVVESFDPAVTSVDSHVDEKLEALRVQGDDRAFVQQIAYGAFRMDRPLRAFLNAFYHIHATSLSRGDFNLYLVLSYVGLFRLTEVTFSRFLGLLAAQVGCMLARSSRYCVWRQLFARAAGPPKDAHVCVLPIRRCAYCALG